MIDPRLRDFARRVAVREVVAQVTPALERAGVESMLLKGAALVLDVYPEDTPRALGDVDLLVRPRDFARAYAALGALGLEAPFGAPHAYSVTLYRADLAMMVDLHGALYSRALFDMPAEALFARALVVPGFTSRVLRPHGLDLVAHAIGHFAKTRPRLGSETLVRDIEQTIARDALDIDALAAHLVRAGLARATRYALEGEPSKTARALLAALPRDPLARPLVALARHYEDAPLETLTSVAPRHLLNRSLARGLVSFGYQGLDALTRKLSRRP